LWVAADVVWARPDFVVLESFELEAVELFIDLLKMLRKNLLALFDEAVEDC